MKPEDGQLNRLLKAAAAAPKAPAGGAVFAIEARVLGNWRGSFQTDSGEFLVAAFRRAAICGCILALASLTLIHHDRGESGGALAVADSAMQMGAEP